MNLRFSVFKMKSKNCIKKFNQNPPVLYYFCNLYLSLQ
ncbi:hypothetical protein HJ01_00552 [Flavobacterium frigoris PS1]|uniref:Uncharacterized protein n=1 Tax=Flavobacterium frigoris (strain PS1) TaxID=1086011 RepID=H7FN78_FLAFP|nr:hypothetical protein HJ01_00552 [Flavobacterium frigoris PS1]